MMKKIITVISLSLIFLLLYACSLIQPETPEPAPTIDFFSEQHWQTEGVVLNVRTYEHIVVDFGETKDRPNEIAFFGTITFTDDCLVWKLEGEAVQPASLDDLTIGQRIKLTAKEILEDYSIIAREVIILSPGAIESQTPISNSLTPQFTGTITAIDDYVKNNITKLIKLDVISSPKHPEVEETSLALVTHSLLWKQTETGYQLIKEDDLMVGQIISVLLQYAYNKDISDQYPYHGLVEEAIVLP
jgi:hypothetical protein